MRVLKHHSLCAYSILMITFLVMHRPVLAADAVPTDRLLPPEVKVYFSMPSVTEFKARLKQSSYGKLLDDQDLADFWSDVKKQIDEASADLKGNIGLSLNELLEIPSGEVAFAIVQPEGKKIGLVAFLDFGDEREKVDQLLDKATEHLDENGWTHREEEFEDTQIDFYKLSADGDGNPVKNAPEFAFFVKDSVAVVGSSVDVLESVLVRWDGKHKSTFADNEVYSYIIDRCSDSDSVPAATWYVDPIGLVEGAINSAAQPNFQAQMVLNFLPQLGLTQIKAIGGAVDIATEDFDSVGKTMIYVPPPVSGVLNALQFPATEQSPPAWVSDEFTAMYSFNWDVIAAFNAIQKITDSFQGEGAFATLVERAANSGPMIHIKTDVVDQLSGKMHFLRGAADETNPLGQKFLVAFELQNPDRLKGTIEKLTKLPGFPSKTRDFRGVTVYEMPQPGAQNSMGFAVAREHLMIASDVTTLEAAIRDEAGRSSLAKSEDFQRIAQHFPEKTSIQGFQKQDSQVQALYEMLRSGKNLIPGASGDLIPGVDFTKLPPFESIQKYLKPSGTYTVPDERGALVVSFSVK